MSTTTYSAFRRLAGASATALSLAAAATTASAQSEVSDPKPIEFRITSGALIPTRAMRSSLTNAQVTATQLSWLVAPKLAITGTFAWGRSKDGAAVGSPKLDVFTYDLGLEGRTKELCADCRVSLKGFAGAGAGARSYNYRKLDVAATHNVAGYLAAGGEVGLGRVGVRVEVRDYATGFKPLAGSGASASRNDVVVMAALRFNRKSGS